MSATSSFFDNDTTMGNNTTTTSTSDTEPVPYHTQVIQTYTAKPPLDHQAILTAVDILGTQFDFSEKEHATKLWKVLIDGLSVEEAVERHFVLRGILVASVSIDVSLESQPLRAQLAKGLSDIVAGDESSFNRPLAARILGQLYDSLLPTSPWLSTFGFTCVMLEVEIAFPKLSLQRVVQDMFTAGQENLPHVSVFRKAVRLLGSHEASRAGKQQYNTDASRIHLISALGYFLECTSAQQANLRRKIDDVLLHVLEESPNLYLKLEVVRILYRNLRRTNRNRLRVRKFLASIREMIYDIDIQVVVNDALKNEFAGIAIEPFNSVPAGSGKDSRPSSQPSSSSSSSSSSSKSSLPKYSPSEKVMILTEISRFWAFWYPKPYDEILMMFPNADLLIGYAKYRQKALVNIIDDGIDNRGRVVTFTNNAMIEDDEVENDDNLYYSAAENSLIARVPDMEFEEYFPVFTALSFNLTSRDIRFDGTSNSRKVFLQNHSEHSLEFFIQTDPAQFFKVFPATGYLPAGQSLPIVFSFNPQPFHQQRSSKIEGFARVRNGFGFPLERIHLMAFNGPQLKLITKEINCGFCPIGDKRCFNVIVKNIGLATVTCSFRNNSDNPVFLVKPDVCEIAPGNVAILDLWFSPQEMREIENDIHIQCMSEIYTIHCVGRGGQALRVQHTDVDFGLCTINKEGMFTRMLTLVNQNTKLPLPVTFHANSPNIRADNLTLEPLETRHVEVNFTPSINGMWEESLGVIAPNTKPLSVEMNAFVGPLIILPCSNQIFFPATVVGIVQTVRIPVINRYDRAVEFTLRVQPPFSCSGDGIDSRTTSFSLPALSSMTFEFNFDPTDPGVYSSELQVVVHRPETVVYKNHTMFAFCTSPSLSQSDANAKVVLETVRKYMRDPFLNEPDGPVFPPTDEVEPVIEDISHTVYSIYPSAVALFRHPSGDHPTTNVVLQNVSNVSRAYHIIVSAPFVIDVPLDGLLIPSERLNINVTMMDQHIDQSSSSSSSSAKDNGDGVHVGVLSVLDHNEQIVCSAELRGLSEYMVTIDLEDEQVTLPSTYPDAMVSTSFQICNWYNASIDWEINLPNAMSSLASSPFRFSEKKGVLKPYEKRTITVEFQSSVQGTFTEEFQVLYVEPSFLTGTRVQMFAGHLHGVVGDSQFELGTDLLDFGTVEVGKERILNVQLVNTGPQEENVLCMLRPPFYTKTQKVSIPSQASYPIDIHYQPSEVGHDVDYCMFYFSTNTMSLPLMGNAGTLSLMSNFGAPSTPETPTVIDFGLCATGHQIVKRMTLENTGTLDVTLHGIQTSSSILSWVCWLHNNDTTSAPNFGSGDLDDLEVDWDELEYEQVEQDREEQMGIASVRKQKKSNQLEFPYVLKSGEELTLSLSLKSEAMGEYSPTLSLMTVPLQEDLDEEPVETYQWQCYAAVQPQLSVSIDDLDFGKVAIGGHTLLGTALSNEGTMPITWKLLPPQDTSEFTSGDSLDLPFEIYPTDGTMAPGEVTKISVNFKPTEPQKEVSMKYLLSYGDLGAQYLTFHGIGATAIPTLDAGGHVDFGCLRLNHTVTKNIRLRNLGMLDTKLYVVNTSGFFSVEMDSELLEGLSSQNIKVSFTPTALRNFKTKAHIKFWDDSPPLELNLVGSGGTEDIVVRDSKLDYGTALLNFSNQVRLNVYNEGTAEGDVEISLEQLTGLDVTADPSRFSLPAGKQRTVTLTYHPIRVENLKTVITVTSGQGLYQKEIRVDLVATVGAPNLFFEPENIFENPIDFEVALIHSTHKLVFGVTNKGNIDLDYRFVFMRSRRSHSTLNLLKDLDGHKSSSSSSSSSSKLGHIYRPSIEWNDGHMEEFDPRVMKIEPHYGTVQVGQTLHFTLSFSPKHFNDIMECFLVLKNKFQWFRVPVHGVGGESRLQFESPLRDIDFGLCRTNNTSLASFSLVNHGNMGCNFFIRPLPADQLNFYLQEFSMKLANPKPMEKQSFAHNIPQWLQPFHEAGFRMDTYDGYCRSGKSTTINISFTPNNTVNYTFEFALFHPNGYEQFTISAQGGVPKLELLDRDNEMIAMETEYDLGSHSVGRKSTHTFFLKNTGSFVAPFFVRPEFPEEFTISPMQGHLAPGRSVPFDIHFKPTDDKHLVLKLRIVWDGPPIVLSLHAVGTMGKLQMQFLNEADAHIQALDFDLVALNTVGLKYVKINNNGKVDVPVYVFSKSSSFTVAQLDEDLTKSLTLSKLTNKDDFYRDLARIPKQDQLQEGFETFLKSGQVMYMQVCLAPQSEGLYSSYIKVKCEYNSLAIQCRGTGGAFTLEYVDNLQFGEIALHHKYSRTLTLYNTGSTPSLLNFYWKVDGHSDNDRRLPMMSLEVEENEDEDQQGEINNARALWKKTGRVALEHEHRRKAKMKAKRRWMMLRSVLLGHVREGKTELEGHKGNLTAMEYYNMVDPSGSSSSSSSSSNAQETTIGLGRSDNHTKLINLGNEMVAKIRTITAQDIQQDQDQRSSALQTLFTAIRNRPIKTQSPEGNMPHLYASPMQATLYQYGKLDVDVSLMLNAHTNLKAVLVCESALPGVEPLEIPLSAMVRKADLIVNDTSTLNFGRQPMGEIETKVRKFTNTGTMKIHFRVKTDNLGLTVTPHEGILPPGKTIDVKFSFRPMVESVQCSSVNFESDVAPAVKLNFYGSGGVSKLSLPNFDHYDFGRCMIGKDTTQFIKIGNTGNAYLRIYFFDIAESRVFRKGEDWPSGEVLLKPNKSYHLPIVFHPLSENPSPSRLTIHCNVGSFTIDLIGSGRQALLNIGKPYLTFPNCLVGNTYYETIEFSNIGDVNYPLAFTWKQNFPDAVLIPESVVLAPFEKMNLNVIFKPTGSMEEQMELVVDSPYTRKTIPSRFFAGNAELVFSTKEVDFGLFAYDKQEMRSVTMLNSGNMPLEFTLMWQKVKHIVRVSRTHGTIGPGEICELFIHFVGGKIIEFDEEVEVATDLESESYRLRIKGHADRPKVEFTRNVQMGVCAVGELATADLKIENMGGYPLEYKLKATQPVKVAPKQGEVMGHESTSVQITWLPTGSYDLNSVLRLFSNDGTYSIHVSGKATFPDFSIARSVLDFGICEINSEYLKSLVIRNTGRVLLKWKIPKLPEGFEISHDHGNLNPGEEFRADVHFFPTRVKRYGGSFFVEAPGRSKKISVSGVGGKHLIQMEPAGVYEFGDTPCDVWNKMPLHITNNSDVDTYMESEPFESPLLSVSVKPPVFSIEPRATKQVNIMVHCKEPGFFVQRLFFTAFGRTWTLLVRGEGVRIVLSGLATSILRFENLEMTVAPSALATDRNALVRRRIRLEREDMLFRGVNRVLREGLGEVMRMRSDNNVGKVGGAGRLVKHDLEIRMAEEAFEREHRVDETEVTERLEKDSSYPEEIMGEFMGNVQQYYEQMSAYSFAANTNEPGHVQDARKLLNVEMQLRAKNHIVEKDMALERVVEYEPRIFYKDTTSMRSVHEPDVKTRSLGYLLKRPPALHDNPTRLFVSKYAPMLKVPARARKSTAWTSRPGTTLSMPVSEIISGDVVVDDLGNEVMMEMEEVELNEHSWRHEPYELGEDETPEFEVAKPEFQRDVAIAGDEGDETDERYNVDEENLAMPDFGRGKEFVAREGDDEGEEPEEEEEGEVEEEVEEEEEEIEE